MFVIISACVYAVLLWMLFCQCT